MTNRFVVDFRIASQNREDFFHDNWHWPVPQTEYDRPLAEIVNSGYDIPGQLSAEPALQAAYELVELDLIRDLSAALSSWIDVSIGHNKNLDLEFGRDQNFYRMFVDDRFNDYSMIEDLRTRRYRTFRSKVGRAIRRVRKKSKYMRVDGTSLTTSPNALTNEVMPSDISAFRLDFDDIVRQRRSLSHSDAKLASDLASHLADQIQTILTREGHSLTPNGLEYIQQLVEKYIRAGLADRHYKLPLNSQLSSVTLFTGSGGIYQSRLAAHLINRAGGTVVRTTHGGDTVLFEDPFWVCTEITGASQYVTYGRASSEIISNQFSNHPRAQGVLDSPSIAATGSRHHRSLVDSADPQTSVPRGGNVAVISASFTGELRPVPWVKIHDVVYLEWHARLLHNVRNLGFKTISKRHPKGMGAGESLFADFCDIELKEIGMTSIPTRIDGWVTDIAASAFLEAMCSLKPVVLIDIPSRKMTDLARQRISESVQIVEAYFDENNRVAIDTDKLRQALETPFDIDARRRFLDDFLLTPNNVQVGNV